MDFVRNKDHNKIRAWSECVGKAFLKPFDLFDFDSTYCISGKEQHTKQQSHAKVVHTACRDPGMPFPIVIGTIAAVGDPRQFHC